MGLFILPFQVSSLGTFFLCNPAILSRESRYVSLLILPYYRGKADIFKVGLFILLIQVSSLGTFISL